MIRFRCNDYFAAYNLQHTQLEAYLLLQFELRWDSRLKKYAFAAPYSDWWNNFLEKIAQQNL